MILFVTTRRSSLDNERRCRQFRNLGMAWRHISLSDEAFPEVFDSLRRRRLWARLGAIWRGIFRLRAEIRRLSPSDILYVNALDCLAAVLLARMGIARHNKLICQILDVHSLLLYPGPYRRLLRWIERRLLGAIDLLVVPSAGALPRYFRPVAGYRGPAAVVNNRLPSGEAEEPCPAPPFNGTWIIGWFGSLRCERSVKILCHAAAILGQKVEIRIAGTSKLPAGLLEQAIAPLSNITYLGPFAAMDTGRLYRDVHFSWAVHFESPIKAQWALPVRTFEGGAHGRPALVRADTDAGTHMHDNGIGWGIAEPLEQELPLFLQSLTERDYRKVAANVCEKRQLFVGEEQLAQAIAQIRS